MRRVIQFDENFNYINTYKSTLSASKETNINQSMIYKCAKFWESKCDKKKWKDEYSYRPQFKAGGYIWRFYSDFENRD